MKVALVILHADPARGGAERYTFDLALALAERGHEVFLVASTFGPRPGGVECVELETAGLTRLSRYRNFLEALENRMPACDVVHAMLPVRRCDVYHPHAGIAAEAVESGHRKHAALWKRALAKAGNRVNLKRRAFAAVERKLLSDRPPVVLCLSEYVKGTVRKHYPVADDRLATLFNAVDLKRFDPAAHPEVGGELRRSLGLADPQTVGLIIAQDFERKGLREAIAGIAETEAHLVVVGKQNPSAYAAEARRLGIAERVHFCGSTSDTYPYYAAADFLVLPTRHDPCSLVVLEALAMGVPVISTRQNGACEIMTRGEHGFVLESAEDRAGLVNAMRTLCDPVARERMRKACLALRPKLAYETHLDGLLDIYGRAVALREGR